MTKKKESPVKRRTGRLLVSTASKRAWKNGRQAGDEDARYLNREMSYLQFADRILDLAEEAAVPLLERAKFLAIFSNNLDEFYMVRVAGLKRQEAAGLTTKSADGLTATQQIALIARSASALMEREARVFTESVLPNLREKGIRILHWSELSKERRREMEAVFKERIFPILTPLAVDPAHPFPYISNRSLNLAVLLRDRAQDRTHFARVKVPALLPRLLPLSKGSSYVPLEDVIAANLGDLFPGMKILDRHVFRVTRDGDLDVDDDGADDLLSALEQQLTRRRFSRAVRLEIEPGMPDDLLELLMRELQLEKQDVFTLAGPLDLTFLMGLLSIDRAELKDAPFRPATPPDLLPGDDEDCDIFKVLRAKDVLVHHPYESFATSVQAFIEQAAADPQVLAIKQTLYRTSGESPIVDALIEAAEAGKQVVVLVEIKARFDEIANINWARTLEKAGCHVVYGLVGLKTHCKLCMVVRQEESGIRRYVHVGTGNYHPSTARLYEDIGLLTGDDQLGADVGDLFNYLTGYSRQVSYASLLIAPREMRERMVGLIQREADNARRGETARIVFKLNSLIDEAVIEALYDASAAGVSIDIIARGICTLRPGVQGLSENIRVKSIVGRFLEHSRVYYFADSGAGEVFIGSADMMHRNLDRRVEVLVRVETDELKKRVIDILELDLRDEAGTWRLDGSGKWTRAAVPEGTTPFNVQKELIRLARS